MAASLRVGSRVLACREPEEEEEEWEECQVVGVDVESMMVSLRFDGGFVAHHVPLSRVRMLAAGGGEREEKGEKEREREGEKDQARNEEEEPRIVELPVDDGYSATIKLPTPPSAEEMAADSEAKYRYVAEYKAVGNTLFKEGKYAWAIRTYTEAVDRLARNCYSSRERMLWDYFARVPCAQCYSNAALCALKLSDYTHAETLCEHAMECRPEDGDLIKVLLRHGQALLGQHEYERALPLLERAADREPNNRAVREELLRAKKAIKEKAKAADAQIFANIDLHKSGLTSRRAAAEEGAKERLEKGFDRLLDGNDATSLAIFEPLLASKLCAGVEGAGVRLQAAYGAGVAHYHLGRHDEAARRLDLFLEAKQALENEGKELPMPLMGLPLVLFYAAHAAYSTGALTRARSFLLSYLNEAKALGPQQVLNMPDGWGGKKITAADRKASRFRNRACSNEALADGHTMLALIHERIDGPAAALEDAKEAAKLADLGGVDSQRLAARESLSKLLSVLGDAAGAEEQAAEVQCIQEEMQAKAAQKAQEEVKKVEEAQQDDADAEEDEALKIEADGCDGDSKGAVMDRNAMDKEGAAEDAPMARAEGA